MTFEIGNSLSGVAARLRGGVRGTVCCLISEMSSRLDVCLVHHKRLGSLSLIGVCAMVYTVTRMHNKIVIRKRFVCRLLISFFKI